MAMNICPKCAQVTLSLEEASSVKCPMCETEYEPADERDKDNK